MHKAGQRLPVDLSLQCEQGSGRLLDAMMLNSIKQAPRGVQHFVLYLMLAAANAAGAVELRNALTSRFGVELPATVTLDYPSISALAGYIALQTESPDSGIAEPGIAEQDAADNAPNVNVESIR